jgi:heme/copper-type cytochrome/quinol oxidase subunit 2
MHFSRNFIASSVLLSVLLASGLASRVPGGGPRVINVIADKDNRFKVPGLTSPVITVKANEVIKLRITGHKATEWDKDGTVHSFTIKELKDQGWDLRLKEGVQEFTLAAPSDPGEYQIECTVKCGDGHDDMKMKLIVTE